MEAIQQKIELSQQLEDWKTDMEQLLEGTIKERLQDSEMRAHKRRQEGQQQQHHQEQQQQNSNVGSRLLSFFRTS